MLSRSKILPRSLNLLSKTMRDASSTVIENSINAKVLPLPVTWVTRFAKFLESQTKILQLSKLISEETHHSSSNIKDLFIKIKSTLNYIVSMKNKADWKLKVKTEVLDKIINPAISECQLFQSGGSPLITMKEQYSILQITNQIHSLAEVNLQLYMTNKENPNMSALSFDQNISKQSIPKVWEQILKDKNDVLNLSEKEAFVFAYLNEQKSICSPSEAHKYDIKENNKQSEIRDASALDDYKFSDFDNPNVASDFFESSLNQNKDINEILNTGVRNGELEEHSPSDNVIIVKAPPMFHTKAEKAGLQMEYEYTRIAKPAMGLILNRNRAAINKESSVSELSDYAKAQNEQQFDMKDLSSKDENIFNISMSSMTDKQYKSPISFRKSTPAHRHLSASNSVHKVQYSPPIAKPNLKCDAK